MSSIQQGFLFSKVSNMFLCVSYKVCELNHVYQCEFIRIINDCLIKSPPTLSPGIIGAKQSKTVKTVKVNTRCKAPPWGGLRGGCYPRALFDQKTEDGNDEA